VFSDPPTPLLSLETKDFNLEVAESRPLRQTRPVCILCAFCQCTDKSAGAPAGGSPSGALLVDAVVDYDGGPPPHGSSRPSRRVLKDCHRAGPHRRHAHVVRARSLPQNSTSAGPTSRHLVRAIRLPFFSSMSDGNWRKISVPSSSISHQPCASSGRAANAKVRAFPFRDVGGSDGDRGKAPCRSLRYVPMITCCSRGSLLRPGFAILLICHFDNGCANLADRSSSSRQNFFMSPPCSDREGTWTNAFGEQIRFPLVIESAMGALERATRKLNDAMANQSSERVSDLVHEFACSGTHLVYGLATCLRAGWLEPEFSERMKSQ
jgi:hypothetical protein